LPDDAPEQGIDDRHETLGANWLKHRFGPSVVAPVLLHVAAKRYLCATDPAYHQDLSGPSQLSLELQGGPMSAGEVAERLCRALEDDGYSFAVVNFANPDMVGHSGVIPAVVKAVETADSCLGRVVEAVQKLGGVLLITADHGNAEKMLEADGTSPHTAHTTNPVPLIVTDPQSRLRDDGELADLAPTVLDYLGITKNLQMSGQNLCN
jgi:2,3-bisphosphoglycerate-independent phosphoglycerate mutase